MKPSPVLIVGGVAVVALLLYSRRASAAPAPAGVRANLATRRPLQPQGDVTRTQTTNRASYSNPQAQAELLARGVVGLTNFFKPKAPTAPTSGLASNLANNAPVGNAGGLAAYFASQGAGPTFNSSDELDDYRESQFLRNFASSDERDDYMAGEWAGPVVSAVDEDAAYYQAYAQSDGVLSGPVYDVSTDYVANPWTEWGSDFSMERGY